MTLKKSLQYILPLSLFILFSYSCSTEKNTALSRSYHNLTSHYNVFFNAKEAYKQGMNRLESSYQENYAKVLQLFKYSDETATRTIYPDMDKAIKKCSKLIKIHSISAKPKRKKGKKTKKEREFYAKGEYNDYVDDAYLLMGEAHFMKRDFSQAKQSLEYVIKEFPNEELRYPAYIWLARTAIEEKDYVKAREHLDFIEGDNKLPKKYKGDLEMVYADYYMKQGKYEEAVPHMKKGIENTRNKTERLRFQFILAQILQELGQYPEASELYSLIIKKNPNYDMAFSAKIRKASSFSTKYGGADDLLKELNKMLKDDKNIEYQDQIYYAMAEIAMKQADTATAIQDYKLSTEKSLGNTDQKALSCLALATIYYKKPEYRNAQTYYDSTLYFIDPDYPEYDALFDRTKSLTDLVENLDIIDREDSLQYVAALPEKQRDAVIQKLIDEVIEAERKAKEEEQMAQMNAAQFKNQQRDPRNRNLAAGGKWYFYNTTAIAFGQTEFVRLWGRRKLEDNWRRKNKEVVLFEDGGDGLLAAEEDSVPGKKKPSDPKSKEYYMVNLPLSDSLVALSNQKIINAYFKAGEIYKNELHDYPLSAKMFEDMLKRFPGSDFQLFTYYNLFKLFRDQENIAKRDQYKKLIINEYPQSKYAQMFTNPNYLQELAGKLEKSIQLYTLAYADYKAGNYSQAIKQCETAEKDYPESELIPKFKFLKALSLGESKMLTRFAEAIKDIVINYPESEVYEPAHAIAMRLKKENDLASKVSGIDEPEQKVVPEIDETPIYFEKNSDQHFFVLAVPNKTSNLNRIQFQLSNFNFDFFSMTPFNISNVLLSEDIQIVTVKSFPNARKAMDYYKTVLANPDYFDALKGVSYRMFVIGAQNFTTFFQDKDVSRYERFFAEHYSLDDQEG